MGVIEGGIDADAICSHCRRRGSILADDLLSARRAGTWAPGVMDAAACTGGGRRGMLRGQAAGDADCRFRRPGSHGDLPGCLGSVARPRSDIPPHLSLLSGRLIDPGQGRRNANKQ